jgi:hypothetical protein
VEDYSPGNHGLGRCGLEQPGVGLSPPAIGNAQQSVKRRRSGLACGLGHDRLGGAGLQQRRDRAISSQQHPIERIDVR